jgi:CDGSH-type Zn-finger protein
MNPIAVDVEAGKTYWWCRCGLSARQPFCDGAHKGSNSFPLAYKAEQTRQLYFCVCKRTAVPPLCDGSHGIPEASSGEQPV